MLAGSIGGRGMVGLDDSESIFQPEEFYVLKEEFCVLKFWINIDCMLITETLDMTCAA